MSIIIICLVPCRLDKTSYRLTAIRTILGNFNDSAPGAHEKVILYCTNNQRLFRNYKKLLYVVCCRNPK